MRNSSTRLKRELRRLFRSMDFVSKHPALSRRGKEAERFAELYQQLGMLWEFLALQCSHREGWRKVRDGKSACKLCGTIRGMDDRWLLWPRVGKKVIGRSAMPNSKETFASKKAATIVSDAIEFHGAKLRVNVHNRYRSILLRKLDATIAADRIVQLEEDDVECWIDTHLVKIGLKSRDTRGTMPLPYSAFVSELPRKALKNFPVMLEYDQRGRFVGLCFFKPLVEERRAPTSKHRKLRKPI